MNDERIEKHLSVVKRNLHFLWLVLSPLSVGFKILTGTVFSSFSVILPELVLFSGSLFSLAAGLFIDLTADVVDERIVLKKHLLYQRSFLITVIGTGIAYLLQVVLSAATYRLPQIPTNFFVNLVIFLSSLVYYLSARKQNIYLNFKQIEKDKSTYYRQVGKTIRNMGAITLSFGVLGIAFKYLFQGTQSLLMIELTCLFSFLIIAMEYLILSILEKNHFDEALSHEQGKTILLSKNVRLLLVFEVVISFFLELFFSYERYQIINDVDLSPQWTHFIAVVNGSAFFLQLDLLLLTLFATALAFLSLKRSLPTDFQKLKLLFVLYGGGAIVYIFSLLFRYSFSLLPISDTQNGLLVIGFVSNFMYVFSMLELIPNFLCFLLFQKRRYGFSWFFFAKTMFLLLSFLILPDLLQSTRYGSIYVIVEGGMNLAQVILTVLILFRMTKIHINPEPTSEEKMIVEKHLVG